MLQFWKRDRGRRSSPDSSPKRRVNGVVEPEIRGALTKLDIDITGVDRILPKSRLSLTLEDVTTNRIALSYLSQFMEAKGLGHLFNIWAELEDAPSNFHLPPLCRRNSLQGENSECKVSRLYAQYISDESPWRIRLPDDIRTAPRSPPETFLQHLTDTVFSIIKKEVWPEFIRSDWHCKYQIEIMTSGTMTLSDVLYNDSAQSAFLEFVEQEGFSCLVEFWFEATNFERKYSAGCDDVNSQRIQDDAVLIYDRYLSLQAIQPIGVNDRVRFAVEEGICVHPTSSSPHCLSPAVIAVEQFLSCVVLGPFLASQQYLTLLSDVMSSTSSRTNHSPASSVVDGGSLPGFCGGTTHTSDDSLWRRSKPSGLSFGRIDPLGRYETDIEPEPDKKSESRISRVVKLLTNRDEQKTQEEMAWRVAEMIVKDITSITMPPDRLTDCIEPT